MSVRPLRPGLYGIADAAFGDPVDLGLALVAGGARLIQLRAKHWTTAERVRAGRALVEHLSGQDVRLVMNDDLSAALACGAHGLHLGQDDGSLAEARATLGPAAILGRSTHSLQQVRNADPAANYIGFGPVYGTRTKAAAGAARGLELLGDAVRLSAVPVVAIGGIRSDTLAAVQAAGAQHWAVISDILTHPDIPRQARRFAAPPPTRVP